MVINNDLKTVEKKVRREGGERERREREINEPGYAQCSQRGTCRFICLCHVYSFSFYYLSLSVFLMMFAIKF